MTEIKKFEFLDFSGKEVIQEERDLEVQIDHINTEKVLEEFIDQNSLEDIGQTLEPLQDIKLISITQEEFDRIILEKETQAITSYIDSKSSIIEDMNNGKIVTLIEEIKNRIDIELDGILERVLQLSYSIATKVINISLMNIPEENFVVIIKKKIESLGFNNGIRVEVKDQQIAEILKTNGIEVSINSDMLEVDYKIIWCNGFLEKKAIDITSEIEGILIENIKNDTRL